VSCVEKQRWSTASHQSRASGYQHYARARADTATQVTSNLEMTGSRHVDQREIWRDIDEKFTTLGGHSRTGAMSDLYQQAANRLDDYVKIFHPRPAQVGAVFAINNRVLGMELFDSSRTWTRFLSKLIRSYALDALETESFEYFPPDPDAAQQFLSRVRETRKQAYPAVGEGQDLRFMGSDISGGALIAERRVIHLAAFDSTGR